MPLAILALALLSTADPADDPAPSTTPPSTTSAPTPSTTSAPTSPAGAAPRVDEKTLARAQDAAKRPADLASRALGVGLAGAGGAVGGALMPAVVIGGAALSFIGPLWALTSALPPPAPGNFSAGEGYTECVMVPTALCMCGGGALSTVLGIGAVGALSALGAAPAGGAAPVRAAAGGVAGACAGCGVGMCGLCAVPPQQTSSTGIPPEAPARVGFVMATSSVGAGLGAAVATALPIDDVAMPY